MKQFGVKKEDLNLVKVVLNQLHSEIINSLTECARRIESYAICEAPMREIPLEEDEGWRIAQEARDLINILKGLKL